MTTLAEAIARDAKEDIPASVFDILDKTNNGLLYFKPKPLADFADALGAPWQAVLVASGWLLDPHRRGRWVHLTRRRAHVLLPTDGLLGLCLAYRRHVAVPREKFRATAYVADGEVVDSLGWGGDFWRL